MAQTERDRKALLEEAVTALGVQRMALARFLAANGCGVCGDLASTMEHGPTLTLELVEDPRSNAVKVRVTEEVRVLCPVHDPKNALPIAAGWSAPPERPTMHVPHDA
jgi:hypothetical protein